jgi:hypothetical protein
MKYAKKFWENYLSHILPSWAVLPLAAVLVANGIAYYGSRLLADHRFHHDLTTSLDNKIPLIPGFVWIYILAFVFWIINYILAAKRGKDMFYRFIATDLTVHLICFLVFVIFPTTNVRPEIAGNSLSEKMLSFIYAMDGGSKPFNLFPSIHCYVSWLCYRGLKGAKEIPRWYQKASGVMACLVIVSTQVLKQHYLWDAVAAVALVEAAWYFYRIPSRVQVFRGFFERLPEKKSRRKWENLREE